MGGVHGNSLGAYNQQEIEIKGEILLTFHSSPLTVLSGSLQGEAPFCQVSTERLAWEDQKVAAVPIPAQSNINILQFSYNVTMSRGGLWVYQRREGVINIVNQ